MTQFLTGAGTKTDEGREIVLIYFIEIHLLIWFLNNFKISFQFPVRHGFQVLPPFPFPGAGEMIYKSFAQYFFCDGRLFHAFVASFRVAGSLPYFSSRYPLPVTAGCFSFSLFRIPYKPGSQGTGHSQVRIYIRSNHPGFQPAGGFASG